MAGYILLEFLPVTTGPIYLAAISLNHYVLWFT